MSCGKKPFFMSVDSQTCSAQNNFCHNGKIFDPFPIFADLLTPSSWYLTGSKYTSLIALIYFEPSKEFCFFIQIVVK